MSLLISKVPRSLDSKTKLFGFELGDLLLIFFYLAVSNLIFGSTRLKAPFVWGGTLLLSLCLYFVKKGKPERFIEHYSEYVKSPTVFSAGQKDLSYEPYFKKEEEE